MKNKQEVSALSFWDYLIVTASSSAQAEAFRFLLLNKQKQGKLSPDTRYIVIPDGERSIGSGSAFFGVLKQLYKEENCARFPVNKRVLLIQSGGESRRAPQYYVCGKLFAPAINPAFDDMFDELIDSMIPLCDSIEGGIVISTSDIVIKTELHSEPVRGNTAFAIKAPVKTGERHGVFCCDENGVLLSFLHKKPVGVLKATGAVDKCDNVFLDTGVVYFTPSCMDRFYDLANKISPEQNDCRLNFYGDLLYPFGQDADMSGYLREPFESGSASSLESVRKTVFQHIHGDTLFVRCLSEQKFLHIGTPAELLKLKTTDDTHTSCNSVIEDGAEVNGGTYIENSIIDGTTVVGKNCILSYVVVSNATIPDGTGIYCVPLKNSKFVAVVYDAMSTDYVPDSAWEEKRWRVCDTRAEAVRASLAGLRGTESQKSILKNADFFSAVSWKEHVRHRIKSQSYESVRKAILSPLRESYGLSDVLTLQSDRHYIELPLRVNFGGTWTDAAPYCVQYGGTVVNAAISLNGEFPIRADVYKNDSGAIVLKCDDFGVSKTFRDTQGLYDFNDFSDLFSLHKAALIVSGIIPYSHDASFDIRRRIGSGINLTTCAKNVPQGSGLGTSSLLLAASIQALYDITGRTINQDELFQKVFCAEQLMRTGGGWQDQVGGVVPGFKIIRSEPGIPQKLCVESIPIQEQMLSGLKSRACLIYAGERHMGRYILTDIMERQFKNDPGATETLHKLKDLADTQKRLLQSADIEGFIQSLNRHFDLLLELPANAVTGHMRRIRSTLCDLLDAFSPCGAGGGGFCFAVAKNPETMRQITERLKSVFGGRVRVYAFDFVI